MFENFGLWLFFPFFFFLFPPVCFFLGVGAGGGQ